ncbi:hypothetical protein CON65_06100 [Bacillus pseudomycoides]|uniref:Uncharacterized protein n=1 Tax=Bacillus pseudomycoides TaxID=64104 RepID=A0AA91VDU1_9BACI|nr:hypothetical protein COO03_00095 [Bacillus sp. AFS098217]PED83446.1 hypothetical protein CON65_06100 [Bacillus pseudomycoides]PEU15298.1 hypothetical protein CN524_06995 [Bacillus sp. AFS019443]PEU17329.1 hypothetical protein CN525_15005 [Bacillus sp. AFS014408]PFW61042.1 hypothetical protein COL20_18920 [Bacillus sp. AFS075034]
MRDELLVKARLVRANNQCGLQPTLIKVSLYDTTILSRIGAWLIGNLYDKCIVIIFHLQCKRNLFYTTI